MHKYTFSFQLINIILNDYCHLPLQSAGVSHLCPWKIGSSASSFVQTVFPLSHLWAAVDATKAKNASFYKRRVIPLTCQYTYASGNYTN